MQVLRHLANYWMDVAFASAASQFGCHIFRTRDAMDRDVGVTVAIVASSSHAIELKLQALHRHNNLRCARCIIVCACPDSASSCMSFVVDIVDRCVYYFTEDDDGGASAVDIAGCASQLYVNHATPNTCQLHFNMMSTHNHAGLAPTQETQETACLELMSYRCCKGKTTVTSKLSVLSSHSAHNDV